MPRSDLFPPLEPKESGHLAVGDGHRLYWEQAGRRTGEPVVFLHGGPGTGCSPEHRRFFDPRRWRIILFDQRGAGRSTPLGSLEENNTQALIADIEALRRHLGIERWTVFGGSWGSTLALAYAERHPERVAGLILRGIFLGRPQEVEWFLTGMGQFFPEAWREFAAAVPEAGEQPAAGDLLDAYRRRLNDPDPATHLPAALAWSSYEGSCSTLLASPETMAYFGNDRLALSLARIEAHYFANLLFLEPDQLLRDLGRIRHIPAIIVQGRYDVVCPIATADALHRAWPEARYHVVPDGGHSAMDPGIRRALVEATEAFRAAPAASAVAE